MKKEVIVIFVLIFFIGFASASNFFGGDGTVSDPYMVSNCVQLQDMNSCLDCSYILISDIDCSDTVNWNCGGGVCNGFEPIGVDPNSGFIGIFDGRSYTILNLTSRGLHFVGLFGWLGYGGVVKNVGIINVNMYGTGTSTNAGGLVGENFGGEILNSYSTGKIVGFWEVGGLVGRNRDVIFNSYSKANVSGNTYVGGLVGYNTYDDTNEKIGTITNSYSTGSVTRTSGTKTTFGGFVGKNFKAKIFNSYSTGTVYESPGTLWASEDKGFVGAQDTGGGWEDSRNFFDIDTSKQTSSSGNAIGKTTTQMKTMSTFTNDGWDFSSIWKMDANINEGYPSHIKYGNICSDFSQIIMKLYRETNSHGALWDDGNYNYEICFDEIFGFEYSGDNPHECNDDNTFLWLNQETNAHASVQESTDYNIPVCYGNMGCTVRDNTCEDNEKMVLALYSNTNSHLTNPNYMPDGIISWWRFDDGTAKDWVGENNGTIQGATSVDSKIRKGMSFNGNNYIQVSRISDFKNLNAFTLEAWVKFSENSQNNPNSDSIVQLTSLDTATNYGKENINTFFLKRDLDNKVVFSTSSKSTGEFHDLTGKSQLNNNQWYHVTATWDGSVKKVYINGVLDNFSDWNHELSPSSGPLYIGVDEDFNFVKEQKEKNDYMRGLVDEVAIYNRALIPEAIQHRYNMGVYQIKICCSLGSIQGARWENMNGALISSAGLGDLVRMIVPGESLIGARIYYKVKQKRGDGWYDFLFRDKVIAEFSTYGVETWKAGRDEEGNEELGTYYFEARVEGGEWVQSNELIVGQRDNIKPEVEITGPIDGGVYFVDVPLIFSQESSDVDDRFTWAWDFGDGSVESGNSDSIVDVTHTYTSPGQKDVILTVTDDRREYSRSVSKAVSILIIGTPEALVWISNPRWGETVGSYSVGFNVSKSYVVDFGDGVVECLGGACPSQTENCPADSSADCEFLPINNYPENEDDISFEDWSFEWIFDQGYSGEVEFDTNEQEFNFLFGNSGLHEAKVNATFKNSGEDVLTASRVVFSNYIRNTCTNQGRTWWDSEGNSFNTLTEPGVCYSESEFCCPFGMQCIGDENLELCQSAPEVCGGVLSCRDYGNKEMCGQDSCNVGGADTGYGTLTCGDIIDLDAISECENFGFSEYAVSGEGSCKCVWDNDKGCIQSEEIILDYKGKEISGTCKKNIITGDCIDGYLDVEIENSMDWDDDDLIDSDLNLEDLQACGNELCSGDSYTALCGGPVTKLPVFGFINFILVFFILTIYFVLRKK